MTREETKDIIRYFGKIELIDLIFDDIESRTCENCKYYMNESCYNAESMAYTFTNGIQDHDGCNKFERKID